MLLPGMIDSIIGNVGETDPSIRRFATFYFFTNQRIYRYFLRR